MGGERRVGDLAEVDHEKLGACCKRRHVTYLAVTCPRAPGRVMGACVSSGRAQQHQRVCFGGIGACVGAVSVCVGRVGIHVVALQVRASVAARAH